MSGTNTEASAALRGFLGQLTPEDVGGDEISGTVHRMSGTWPRQHSSSSSPQRWTEEFSEFPSFALSACQGSTASVSRISRRKPIILQINTAKIYA